MTTTTTATTTDFSTPEAMAAGMMKVIRESVLIKTEIETLRAMLTATESRSKMLDGTVVELGLKAYVDRYQKYINKLNG